MRGACGSAGRWPRGLRGYSRGGLLKVSGHGEGRAKGGNEGNEGALTMLLGYGVYWDPGVKAQ